MAKLNKLNLVVEEELNPQRGPIVALANSGSSIYALTAASSLLKLDTSSAFQANNCFMSAFPNPIKSLVFPRNFSQVFACAGRSDIRVYTVGEQREILNISIQERPFD